MKKTLQEEKERILEISRKVQEQRIGFHEGRIPDTGDLDDAIGEFVFNCLESGMQHDEIKTIILNSVNDALEANDDEGRGMMFPQDDEDEEYRKQFNKNMTQGFK